MSDPLPLRTEDAQPLAAVSDGDRNAKIEELLLVGLDHYFAANYDQAINVWTRALFLDRSHPRARAYIERARGALAERQRESEELLQNGVAAFHRGDGEEARRLLRAAMDGGAPPEEALGLLGRLDQSAEASSAPARSARASLAVPGLSRDSARPRSAVGLVVVVGMLLAIAAAGVYSAARWDRLAWRPIFTLQDPPASTFVAQPARGNGAPLPRRGETALARARTLAAGGRLHDALAALDRIRLTDAQKVEADRLRAEIQHQLLGLTAPTPGAPPHDKSEGTAP